MNVKRTWKKIRRGIKYPILLFLIHTFIHIIRLFPRKFNLFFYRKVALLIYWASRRMRLLVHKNLRYAYGNKLTDKQIDEIARGVFVNQAWHFSDYVYSLHFKTRKQFSRFIDFEDIDILKKEYDRGKGVICLFNHCGPWELSVLMPPVLGFETTAVSRSLPNPHINKLIVGYREARGMKNINRNGKAYPTLIEAINKGECLIIMIDQDTKVKGVYIDFFEKKAFTPIGAARLALDTEASVVPIQIKRMPNNRYTFRALPAIETIRTGNMDNDLLQNTINYTKAMEQIVRDAPEQWVWMHERWHTTPEIEKTWMAEHQANKEREAKEEAQRLILEKEKQLKREKRRKKIQFWKQ